jgi:glyoxylase-like metal-dependent hydrolase (beta-lactamase superfamily II)
MINVAHFTFNPFQENTFILYDETKECIIIDPGCYSPDEEQELADFIENNQLNPVMLVSTHSHIDHVLGNYFVCSKYDLTPCIHPEDLSTLQNVKTYAHLYGFGNYQPSPEPEVFIREGETVNFGKSSLEVRFVPGHAPGHIVLISQSDGFVINGDCLFYGSIGRTDLPGGDHQTLLDSIRRELFTLPDDLEVYAGHGPKTTIGFEKENNPFLRQT